MKRKPSPAPSVDDLAKATDPGHLVLFQRLREQVLALGGTEERTMYDGLDQAWTPAYYQGTRQLFHVHLGSGEHLGLSATISLNTKKIVPRVLESSAIKKEIRDRVEKARDFRGTKWVFFSLERPADVESFMELVRVKSRVLRTEPKSGP